MRRGLLTMIVLVVAGVVAGGVLYTVTPPVGEAQARVRTLAVRDGATLLTGPVPRRFARSIVASEDARFYSVPGIDPVAIARAAWVSVTNPGVDPGGSTLSQQLAKQLYTHRLGGFRRDLEQLPLAVKLNMHYSKSQILRMYANTVYFGHGYYGLYDASCGYFGIAPRGLSLAQASLLAGLVQAPSAYDPLKHLRLARVRQRYVLRRLVQTGKIDPARAATAAAAPLHLQHRVDAACRPTP